ncbi:MAG: ACT domain-containing protein [bacterium]
MESNKDIFYIVSEKVLSEVLKKTILVKEILKKGESKTIYEAAKKVGISRSAFYKYKDHIFPFYEASREKIITLFFTLSNTPGCLSDLLNKIAQGGANVLTINQSIPLQGIANISISLETDSMSGDIDELLKSIRTLEGVRKVEIIGRS